MNKDLIKRGFDEAEKAHQESQINQIKQIVQRTLEVIDEKTEQRALLDKEIQLLKKDVDDFKAGRLDRLEERQEKDDDAKRLGMVLIKRIEREFIPYQPWRSPYEIYWNVSTGTGVVISTGTMFQNFTGGSYLIGGRTINL